MKPMLTKAVPPPLYYYRSGMRIEGPHPGLQGNMHPELQGDVTGLQGDLDACEITDAERENGIDVATLVRSEP